MKLAFIAALLSATLFSIAQARDYDLVIRNARLFDPVAGALVDDRTILIDGETISDVRGDSPEASAKWEIDAKGRVVSPGFVDSHMHLLLVYGDGGFGPETLNDEDLDLLGRRFLAHGVTTIADLGQPKGWLPTMIDWERRRPTGAPALAVVAGSFGSAHDWDARPPQHHDLLASPEEARAAVNGVADLGARRIKLYWKLEAPEAEAAV